MFFGKIKKNMDFLLLTEKFWTKSAKNWQGCVLKSTEYHINKSFNSDHNLFFLEGNGRF